MGAFFLVFIEFKVLALELCPSRRLQWLLYIGRRLQWLLLEQSRRNQGSETGCTKNTNSRTSKSSSRQTRLERVNERQNQSATATAEGRMIRETCVFKDILEILKQTLQNVMKILKTCFIQGHALWGKK